MKTIGSTDDRTKGFRWLRTILIILVACALNMGIWIASHGVPLLGLPEQEKVASITMVYHAEEERTVTDADGIELLIQAANLCNYRPFSEGEGQPELTVTYHLKDGTDVILEANHNSMWWHGKAHRLKETDSFVNIVYGLFF